MFRDRLQRWGMNDKNQRSPSKKCGKARYSTGKGHLVLVQQKHCPHVVGGTPLWWELSIDAQIQSYISTPRKSRIWHQALKSLLDWQQHLEGSGPGRDKSFFETEDVLTYLIWEMFQVVVVISSNAWSCRSATRKLNNISAAVDNHLRSTCTLSTPLSILRMASVLLRLANHQNLEEEWYDTASRFLVKTAAEALPALHPALLLLKALLFDGFNFEGLSMIYEVGFSIMERYDEHGRSIARQFQFDLIDATLIVDPDAAFGSHADVLCADASDSDDAGILYDLGRLHESRNRFVEADQCLQSCLARLEAQGMQNTPRACDAWCYLSHLQYMQWNVTGEETSLLKALQVILALQGNEDCGLDLSVNMLRSVCDLYAFYERNDLGDKCDALRLKFPRTFEL